MAACKVLLVMSSNFELCINFIINGTKFNVNSIVGSPARSIFVVGKIFRVEEMLHYICYRCLQPSKADLSKSRNYWTYLS